MLICSACFDVCQRQIGGGEDDLDEMDFDIKCPDVHVDITML